MSEALLLLLLLSPAQIGTPTAYGGLTLAGVLATTAHGSGDRTISGIWDTLLEITWVDGTGKVHVSKPDDPEFRGMNGGLGVYGVMTEFLMQMTPPRGAELITVRKSDKDMFKTINELLKVRDSTSRISSPAQHEQSRQLITLQTRHYLLLSIEVRPDVRYK